MIEESENPTPPVKKHKPGSSAEDVQHDVSLDKDKKEREYKNFACSEDIPNLQEFKVLDEVKSNEEDSNFEDSDSCDDKLTEGLTEEEIEKMLEEGLPEDLKKTPQPKEKPYITVSKIVLEDKGVDQFEALPLDWSVLKHHSGMPIYYHKASRVCTLSKPYFLSQGSSLHKHDIPLSAVTCLAYRRGLEEEAKQKEIDRKVEEQVKNLSQNVTKETTGKDLEDNQKKGHSFFYSSPSKVQTESSLNDVISDKSMHKNDLTEPNDNDLNNVKNNEKLNEKKRKLTEVTEDVQCKKPAEVDFANDSVIYTETKNDASDQVNDKSDLNTVDVIKSAANSSKDNVGVLTSNIGLDQKAKKCDDNSKVDVPITRRPVVLPNGEVLPPPRVQTVNSSWNKQHLTPEQLNDYCKTLFHFKTIKVLQFKHWVDRRRYIKAKKALQYPRLPEGSKLISIPAGQDKGGKGKRDWVMNLNGGSCLSVFHEYVNRVLQKQPTYQYEHIDNATSPYKATVMIGDMAYGVGNGSSKRQAKSAAARASLRVLVPELDPQLEGESAGRSGKQTDYSFFDDVGIKDPRVAEFCASTCEPSPHSVLRTCLLRNFGGGDRHIHTETKNLPGQDVQLTMKVGKHTATVVCRNKRAAKQQAAQAILQELHPHIPSWGSLMRLYGRNSVKTSKAQKQDEHDITLLQEKARRNRPNYAVLDKLREEMLKLRQRDEAVLPIGTLLIKDDPPTNSGSNLNNVSL